MPPEQNWTTRLLASVLNKSNWGSKLFFITLLATLIFFWWLLIYSGGASVNHG